jgi:hypothetical protein
MIPAPLPFNEAIRFLLDKDPNPEEWDSRMWQTQLPAIRIRSFFSANVENARFLDRAQGAIFDYMVKTTEQVVGPDGIQRTAIRTGGRADFVRQMRQFMIREGMATEKELWNTDQGDIKDIKSEARLRLIFDTQVRTAYGYGRWRQGMTPAVRRAFPAARLVRVREVSLQRPRHQKHMGEIRLKTDFRWWSGYINGPDIGGFSVPWGPFGFNSGADQEDVSREELDRLGIRYPKTAAPKPPEMNEGLSASTKAMDPALRQRLIDELRGGPKPRSPEEAARQAAERVHARHRGQATGIQIREEEDRIVVVSPEEAKPRRAGVIMTEAQVMEALTAKNITPEQALEMLIASGMDPAAAAAQLRALEE